MSNAVEKSVILLSGLASAGKTSSLRNIRNPEGVLYINVEAKRPPFKDKFKKNKQPITDPLAILSLIESASKSDSIHTIVIDSLTRLMEMYISKHINKNTGYDGWKNYAEFFKTLMLDYIGTSPKRFILIAHNEEIQNNDGTYNYKVPVAGSVGKVGVESYFTMVFYARRAKLSELEELPYDEELLRITPTERNLGVKHVIQTQITAKMSDSKIRQPLGCFKDNQIFVDNDIQLILDITDDYYGLPIIQERKPESETKQVAKEEVIENKEIVVDTTL